MADAGAQTEALQAVFGELATLWAQILQQNATPADQQRHQEETRAAQQQQQQQQQQQGFHLAAPVQPPRRPIVRQRSLVSQAERKSFWLHKAVLCNTLLSSLYLRAIH